MRIQAEIPTSEWDLHARPEQLQDFVGETPVARAIRSRVARRVRERALTLLIHGETGTGRRLLARAFHAGIGSAGPFHIIDCSSSPGHSPAWRLLGMGGPAPGTDAGSPSAFFPGAPGGTVLVHEANLLSPHLQSVLIRVARDRLPRQREGAAHDPAVRLVITTRADPSIESVSGSMVPQLHAGLGIPPIVVPPLRERRDDISLLVAHFVQMLNAQLGLEVRSISTGAAVLLRQQPWPGNVRQLKTVIERALVLESGEVLLASHLPPEIRAFVAGGFGPLGSREFACGRGNSPVSPVLERTAGY